MSMRAKLPAVFVGCLLAVFAGHGIAMAAAGSVLGVSGQCFREAGGQRSVLKLGDAVEVGDVIDVPPPARLKLRMSDGSVIAAAPGTRLTIEAYAVDGQRDAKLSLGSGLLRAVVSSLSQPSKFEVETATGVAAVRSTDWFIDAKPDSTQVGVLDGTVSLTSRATSRTINIPARWGARVEAGKNPVPARVWSKEEFDDVIARTTVN